MIFWIATGNKGKRKEFLTLLSPYPCYFLKDLPQYKAPAETGSSFQENAHIKALALKEYLNQRETTRVPADTAVVGEDSGLEVLALGRHLWADQQLYPKIRPTDRGDNPRPRRHGGSAPGIYSARYAGRQATDRENVDLLLKNMKAIPEGQRQAVFVSHIVALSFGGREYSVEGRLEGVITRSFRGDEGFGYDPVFIPKGENQTLAELGVTYKNRFSHRAKAVQKLLTTINLLDT